MKIRTRKGVWEIRYWPMIHFTCFGRKYSHGWFYSKITSAVNKITVRVFFGVGISFWPKRG